MGGTWGKTFTLVKQKHLSLQQDSYLKTGLLISRYCKDLAL